MVRPREQSSDDERESPRSLAHGERDDADLDAPYDRARERKSAGLVLDRLRVHLAAQPDDPSKLRALAFLDSFEAQRDRCLAGTCRPSCAHPFRRRDASGKSRPDGTGSERPLAAAVPA